MNDSFQIYCLHLVLQEPTPDEKAQSDLLANITPEQFEDIREAFELFDKDGGGTITVDETRGLFKCFDIILTPSQLHEIFSWYDSDESGSIDFQEFCLMMSNIIMQKEPEPELYEAFRVFNLNESGGINAREIHATIERFNKKGYNFDMTF